MKKQMAMILGVPAILAGLAACSSSPVRDPRVSAVTTTVDSPETSGGGDEIQKLMVAELSGWDERVGDLKASQLQTKNRDRFDQIASDVKSLDDYLADARQQYLDMRLAETDASKNKYKEKLNNDLQKMREIYNRVPAE